MDIPRLYGFDATQLSLSDKSLVYCLDHPEVQIFEHDGGKEQLYVSTEIMKEKDLAEDPDLFMEPFYQFRKDRIIHGRYYGYPIREDIQHHFWIDSDSQESGCYETVDYEGSVYYTLGEEIESYSEDELNAYLEQLYDLENT